MCPLALSSPEFCQSLTWISWNNSDLAISLVISLVWGLNVSVMLVGLQVDEVFYGDLVGACLVCYLIRGSCAWYSRHRHDSLNKFGPDDCNGSTACDISITGLRSELCSLRDNNVNMGCCFPNNTKRQKTHISLYKILWRFRDIISMLNLEKKEL